jgi:4a-hydroxytetrahydrobiopterin dehydratase
MWTQHAQLLQLKLRFNSFAQAMAFVNAVAWLAEAANHHPTITLTYTRLELTLTTHDAGNTLTEQDWALADAIAQRVTPDITVEA